MMWWYKKKMTRCLCAPTTPLPITIQLCPTTAQVATQHSNHPVSFTPSLPSSLIPTTNTTRNVESSRNQVGRAVQRARHQRHIRHSCGVELSRTMGSTMRPDEPVVPPQPFRRPPLSRSHSLTESGYSKLSRNNPQPTKPCSSALMPKSIRTSQSRTRSPRFPSSC